MILSLSTSPRIYYTCYMTTKSPYILKDTDLFMTSGEMTRPYRIVPMKIRDMPEADKPREKILSLGPDKLSIKELIAIVLGRGTSKDDVLAMSERIVKEYGEQSLSRLTDAKRLAEDADIPLNKAMQVVACGELGRRFFSRPETGRAVIRVAEDVYEYAKDMAALPKEHLRGIYLDTHYRVIHDEIISIGTINSSVIHPREVLKPAIEYSAAAFVLVHNHPSGVATPSESDIEITKRIIEIGNLMGIHLLDHVIVTKNGFMSVAADY